MLLTLGLAVRLTLLLLGLWQDAHFRVKYTDIDYEVITDGAAFVLGWGSPYQRSTYRYSPLLAYLVLPNLFLHKAWGKLVFCAADIVAARLMQILLAKEGVRPCLVAWSIALWLFNPLSVTMSTRGSGEALVTCLLLQLLLLLKDGRAAPAGMVFGLVVHLRVYPIIYAWPIFLYIGLQARHAQQGRCSSLGIDPWQKLTLIWSGHGTAFGLSAVATFGGLGALFFVMYGPRFLQESYLYHATRVDPRHNFSPFFYPAYLASSSTAVLKATRVGLAFTAAQAVLQLSLGWQFAADLPFCLLLQTVALVAFNKVCTAQYFVWYLTFLPLVLPQLLEARNKGWLLMSTVTWTVAMLHWLFWAYHLEFEGRPLYMAVWAASLAFLAAHVWLLVELVHSKRAGKVGAKLKIT